MKSAHFIGLTWYEKAGLLFTAFLFVIVAIIESSADLKTKAYYYKAMLTQEEAVQGDEKTTRRGEDEARCKGDSYPSYSGSSCGHGQCAMPYNPVCGTE